MSSPRAKAIFPKKKGSFWERVMHVFLWRFFGLFDDLFTTLKLLDESQVLQSDCELDNLYWSFLLLLSKGTLIVLWKLFLHRVYISLCSYLLIKLFNPDQASLLTQGSWTFKAWPEWLHTHLRKGEKENLSQQVLWLHWGVFMTLRGRDSSEWSLP